MRFHLILYFLLLTTISFAQIDSARGVPVPEKIETSYESEEIWFMALIGLLALVALYFLFRRWRRTTE